jgi:hypothetical protein
MTQSRPDPENPSLHPQPAIDQTVEKSTVDGGMQAIVGSHNTQNQANSSAVGNTVHVNVTEGLLSKVVAGGFAVAIAVGSYVAIRHSSGNPLPSLPAEVAEQTALPMPENALADQILGIWYAEDRCSGTGYSMSLKGTTEYLASGNFQSVGDFSISGVSNGQTVQFDYRFLAAGEWTINGDVLVQTIADLKAIPQTQNAPPLQDYIPQGMTSEYTILEVGSSTIKVQSTTGSCREVLEYEKRSQHYN